MKLGDSVRGMNAPRFFAPAAAKGYCNCCAAKQQTPYLFQATPSSTTQNHQMAVRVYGRCFGESRCKSGVAGVETCVLNALPAFPGSHTAVDPFFLNARMVGSRHQKVVLCGRCGVPLALHAASCVEMFKNGGNWKTRTVFFLSFISTGGERRTARVMATTGEGCQDVVDRLHGRHTCPDEGTGVSVSVGTKGGGTHLPNIWRYCGAAKKSVRNLTFSSR